MLKRIKNRLRNIKFIYLNYVKLQNLKFSIISYIQYRNSYSVNSLKKYKDSHKGERCFIIGNGPSLKVQDLERIKNEYTMGSNRIFTIYNETDFRPTYYFAQDQLVIRSNIDEIKALDGIKFIRSIGAKRYSDSTFIQFYIDDYNYLSKKSPKFANDISKCTYEGYTVTYSMIQFAVFMGFKEIYLLGVDTNYSISNGAIDANSYFNKKMFDKNKIGELPDIVYNLMAYKVAKQYAESHGIKIYNATYGGMLEVFKRVNFDSLFEW